MVRACLENFNFYSATQIYVKTTWYCTIPLPISTAKAAASRLKGHHNHRHVRLKIYVWSEAVAVVLQISVVNPVTIISKSTPNTLHATPGAKKFVPFTYKESAVAPTGTNIQHHAFLIVRQEKDDYLPSEFPPSLHKKIYYHFPVFAKPYVYICLLQNECLHAAVTALTRNQSEHYNKYDCL